MFLSISTTNYKFSNNFNNYPDRIGSNVNKSLLKVPLFESMQNVCENLQRIKANLKNQKNVPESYALMWFMKENDDKTVFYLPFKFIITIICK